MKSLFRPSVQQDLLALTERSPPGKARGPLQAKPVKNNALVWF